MSIDSQIKDGVLHIIYKNAKDIPKNILQLANAYEGDKMSRIGFNIPISFIKKHDKNNEVLLKHKNIEYIIVYKKGDVITKMHELQHAKYHMDSKFKESVKKLWESLTEKYKTNVLKMLKKMGYPDDDNILLDEFQAYYYTEKSNFFN